jgi:steroid 5-alpha reductase family enzyme
MDLFFVYLTDIVLVTWLFMTMVFIFAILRKDNSIVDSFWGLGFILIALYSLSQSGQIDLRKVIVNVFIIMWGLRLAIHITIRNRGKGEDFRYKAWRNTWKLFYLRSYIQIFLLQGLIMVVVSYPVWLTNFTSAGKLGLWDFFGLVLFGSGFLTEVTADSQLSAFKTEKRNQGKLLSTGLWAFSRHPNYFGEALLWWGFSFYTLSLPFGWTTFISPVIMTLLLRYISGVPMLENHFSKHPDWEAYKKKTAPFVPFLHRF